jgi:hypothetical protein
MATMKVGQSRNEEAGRHRVGRGDRDVAGRLRRRRAERRLDVGELDLDLARPFEQAFASVGQPVALRRALEQLLAQADLERFDVASDGGGVDAQEARRRRQASGFGDLQK